MPDVKQCDVPADCLLEPYAASGFADAYTAPIHRAVSHEQFIAAFYTTWLFKLERFVLRWLMAKPSSDDDVARLASGESDSFAAWRVEARSHDEILMCDVLGNTRSWLKVASDPNGGTHLYFGSAVVARVNPDTGERSMGRLFHSLLGFHRLYSKALLRAAHGRLRAMNH